MRVIKLFSREKISIIDTYNEISNIEDKYLKIDGTEEGFLGIEQNKLIVLICFPDHKSLGKLEHPPDLEFKKVEGELEFSSNRRWLQISLSSNTINYFSNFLDDCLFNLQKIPTVAMLNRILKNWRKHWRYSSSNLTREERIGLFGELLVLKYSLENVPGFSWGYWQGAGVISGLHDFQSQDYRIEVKTTTASQNNGEIHVFDSEQFYAIPNLNLCVICLNEDDAGDNISDVIEDIIRTIRSSNSESYENFTETLSLIRTNFSEYSNERYILRNVMVKSVEVDGPFLQKNDILNRPISDIQYKILIDELNFDYEGGLEIISNLNLR